MNHYRTVIDIHRPAAVIFEAISKKLGKWWGQQDKLIDKQGTIFTVAWGEPWYQFEVISYEQDQEMIWTCIDANQKIEGLTGIEKEWVGTSIHWRLKKVDENRSLLEFEHEGLVPAFLCFDFCSTSWEHFLGESLVNFVTKGK